MNSVNIVIDNDEIRKGQYVKRFFSFEKADKERKSITVKLKKKRTIFKYFNVTKTISHSYIGSSS